MIPEPVPNDNGPERELISPSRVRADQGREQGKEGKGSKSFSPSTPTSSTSTRGPGVGMDGQSIDLEAIKARRALYEAALNARTTGKEWCDPVAFAAIDCTVDVPALVAEVERQAAIIEAVEKLHPKVQRGSGDHYYCDPDECDRAGEGSLIDVCGECRQLWPCTTVAALSSPVSLSDPSGGSV
jgi:hypothetical protein